MNTVRARRISVTSLVDVHELSGFALWLATTRSDASGAVRWLAEASGFPVTGGVGTVSQDENGGLVLGLGPGRWLMRAPGPFADREPPRGMALFDVSDAWRLFQLSGIAARRLLASGCPLDLDPRQFPSRRCAATRFDGFRMLLCCTAPETYETYVARSFVEDFRARIVLRAAALSTPAEMEA